MYFTLVGLSVPKAKKACLPKCDLTYFFVQLHFDFVTYRQSLTTIARQKVTCMPLWVIAWVQNKTFLTAYDHWVFLRKFAPVLVWNCYGDRLTDHVWLLVFAAKLCTSSGEKLLWWSLDHDWPRTTIGFCWETLHQIAWLTTYDYCRGTQRGYSSKPLNIALLNVF